MTSSVFSRARVLVRPYRVAVPEGIAVPFGIDPPEGTHWRMSRDVWDELTQAAGLGIGSYVYPSARLLGMPIAVDRALPPDSLLLESKEG